MIKGIYFKKDPYMDASTISKILLDINFFNKDNKYIEIDSSSTVKRYTYMGNDYITLRYYCDKLDLLLGMKILLNLIEKSNNKLLKTFTLNNSIFASYPNFYNIDKEEGDKMSYFIEELMRVSAFLLKTEPSKVPELIKDYIDLSISYPSKD